jgi:hypothetical protein
MTRVYTRFWRVAILALALASCSHVQQSTTGAIVVRHFGCSGRGNTLFDLAGLSVWNSQYRRAGNVNDGIPLAVPAGRYALAVSITGSHCFGKTELAVGPGLTRSADIHLDDYSKKTDAAEDVFSEVGGYIVGRLPSSPVAVAAMSIDRIARPAAVGPGAFYFDFIPSGAYTLYVYGPNWTVYAHVQVGDNEGVECNFRLPTGTSVGILLDSDQTKRCRPKSK